MIINGEVIEVGELEGEGGERGFVIARKDGSTVTVKGLSEDEAREAVQMLYVGVQLRLEANATGTPP